MDKKTWICFALAAAMMAGAAGFLVRLKAHQRIGEPGLSLDLPPRVLGYRSEPISVGPDEIAALPKDTSFSRRLYTWSEGGRSNQLQLGIVLMKSDRTSIHKPQFCLTGQGWNITQTELISVPVALPHAYELPIMKLTATKQVNLVGGPATARALYLYWFVAEDSVTASHWARMWRMATHLLRTGVLQRWAYVSCFAVCWPGQEEDTYQRMRQFLSAAVPQFQTATGPAARPSVPLPLSKR
jgi:hypothetical protein